MKSYLAAIALSGCMMVSPPAHGQDAVHRSVPFSHAISNIPGKSLVAVEVSDEPGGATASHTHASSAFIYGYVISGAIVSQLEGQPEKIYKPGESFYEDPRAHHVLSRNASKTEPAKFLVVFIVDNDDKTLTTLDKRP